MGKMLSSLETLCKLSILLSICILEIEGGRKSSYSYSNMQETRETKALSQNGLNQSNQFHNVTGVSENNGLNNSSPELCGNGNGVGAGDGGCPLNGLNMKKLSIEIIRHDILRKLHMDENNLPNITVKNFPIPPIYLNEFINIQNDTPLEYEETNKEKIVAFSRMQKVKMNEKESKSAFYFTFSDKLVYMKMEGAVLYVHVKHGSSGGRKWPEFRVKIFEIIQHSRGESIVSILHGPFKPQNGPLETTQTRHHRSKWIQIDIRDILSKWIEKMTTVDRKIGFVIELVDLRDNPSSDISVLMSNTEVDVNTNPFIEIRLSDEPKTRSPRNIGMDCTESSQETRCCRFPLVIDFEEFGWDWIIAPKKYDANYCSGECPFAFLQKYPHNHIVQQAGIGGPCCAARKMSPITMLYFDKESNIVFSVLNGMVVDKCGCS